MPQLAVLLLVQKLGFLRIGLRAKLPEFLHRLLFFVLLVQLPVELGKVIPSGFCGGRVHARVRGGSCEIVYRVRVQAHCLLCPSEPEIRLVHPGIQRQSLLEVWDGLLWLGLLNQHRTQFVYGARVVRIDDCLPFICGASGIEVV